MLQRAWNLGRNQCWYHLNHSTCDCNIIIFKKKRRKRKETMIQITTRLSQDLIFEISLLFPGQIRSFFFCGPPADLWKVFENTSVSIYRRGVLITTEGQLLIYLGQNRKFHWLCTHFHWLFLTNVYFTDLYLTFLTCDIPDYKLLYNDASEIRTWDKVLHLTIIFLVFFFSFCIDNQSRKRCSGISLTCRH